MKDPKAVVWKFSASDFESLGIDILLSRTIAKRANELLVAALAQESIVYGGEANDWNWSEELDYLDTHQAYLVGIVPIPEKPKEPEFEFVETGVMMNGERLFLKVLK